MERQRPRCRVLAGEVGASIGTHGTLPKVPWGFV